MKSQSPIEYNQVLGFICLLQGFSRNRMHVQKVKKTWTIDLWSGGHFIAREAGWYAPKKAGSLLAADEVSNSNGCIAAREVSFKLGGWTAITVRHKGRASCSRIQTVLAEF
jgi:hypothetical protein